MQGLSDGFCVGEGPGSGVDPVFGEGPGSGRIQGQRMVENQGGSKVGEGSGPGVDPPSGNGPGPGWIPAQPQEWVQRSRGGS